MEDDVDIYADLPSLDLNSENKDQDCNYKELKKEHSLLLSKLENLQKININLENNLSSLLKTAKAEIVRKDKMINDLRQRLNDVTCRSNKNEGFGNNRSQQCNIRKYDVFSMHSEESETESHEIGFHQNEYKNRKLQNHVNRISTVFGERLIKKIMETEEEEKKQKALLKLDAEEPPYRKNGYKYSPSRRSYSRSRSDYGSSHRLRERSIKTYRKKKYDDYRYKNDRLRCTE